VLRVGAVYRVVLCMIGLTGVYAGVLSVMLGSVLLERATFLRPGDATDQSLCWLGKVFAAAKLGEIVLWDFSTMAGVSFIGEMQTAPLYPLALLFGYVSDQGPWRTMDLFLATHFLLASVGMHLCARRLGLGVGAAFVSALIFTYGTSCALRVGGQPNLFASLAWMPWIVIGSCSAVAGHGTRRVCFWSCFSGLCLGMCLLAGHAHAAIIAICTAAVYMLQSTVQSISGLWARAMRTVAVAAVIGLVGACVAAPQLVATAEYMRLSYKWYGQGFTEYPHIVPYEVFKAGSLNGADLLTAWTGEQVVALDGGTLYLTTTGLVLVAASIALGVQNRSGVGRAILLPSVILALGALGFAFPSIEPIGYLFHQVPIVNLVRTPARGLFMFAFAMSLLAGLGLHFVVRGVEGRQPLVKRWRLRASQACTVLVAVLLIAELSSWIPRHVTSPLNSNAQIQSAVIDHPIVAVLRSLSTSSQPRYRYFASSEDAPPNAANLVPLLSAHGYRSSRNKGFHNYFDFDPQSGRADELGIRWWVTSEAVPDWEPTALVNGVHGPCQ